MGDVLTVCVEVMGTPIGGPCTTEVCTVIIIPPAVPECIGSGNAEFIYYPERYNQPPQNNFYALVLEATSYSSPLYEHIWVIEDRRSGQTFTDTGRIVSLGSRDIVTRTSRLNPDLRVCHIVVHRIDDCIVAKHCEEVQPDCRQSSSYGVINNLSFNTMTKVLSYTFNLPPGPFQDITYIRNGVVSTPTSVTTSGTNPVTYTVTYQYSSDCGSVRIELVTLAENTGGTRYCNFSEDRIQWGNHPCIVKEPKDKIEVGFRGTEGKAKREAAPSQQHFDVRLAPNPTEAFTTVYLNSKSTDDVDIQVLDLNGRVTLPQHASIAKGENAIRLEVSQLTPGIYFVKINGKKNGFAKLEIM